MYTAQNRQTMHPVPPCAMKRKNDAMEEESPYGADTHEYVTPCFMPPVNNMAAYEPSNNATTAAFDTPVRRPTTPPLSMTLSHFDASTGNYTHSQVRSTHQISSTVCTGMTSAYRGPTDRWGSCLI
ncbi:hypothetical protein BC940DRAFT_319821 [Gongronella butleri]|nr:hypothetical protein BC940DRAFT_319821 [Gongronella butleri]